MDQNGFFKDVYKKSEEEIIVFKMRDDGIMKKPTDFVKLLAGRLVRYGYHVTFEYCLTYSDGTKYHYDLYVHEFPFLVIDVDDNQYHELPKIKFQDGKKDSYTKCSYRMDVVRILNEQIENNLDTVLDWLIGKGTDSNQAAMEVNNIIQCEKQRREEEKDILRLNNWLEEYPSDSLFNTEKQALSSR